MRIGIALASVGAILLLLGCQTTPAMRVEAGRKHLLHYEEHRDEESLERAVAELRRATQEDPDSFAGQTLLCLALTYRALAKDDESVLEEMRRAHERAIALNEGMRKHLVHPSYIAADTYVDLSSGRPEADREAYRDKAVEELRIVIREEPGFAPAHRLLGRIYYWRGERELARFEAEQAVRLAPRDAAAHLLLGDVYAEAVRNGVGEECYDTAAATAAIAAYRNTVRLAPESPRAHASLSEALVYAGRFDLALFEARRAVALRPTSANRTMLGLTLLMLGRPAEAEQSLLAALEDDPEHAWAHGVLGLVYFGRERFGQADRAYTGYGALSEEPYFYAGLHHGLALRELGRHDDARRVVERTRERADDDFEASLARFHLGEIGESELEASAESRCQRASLLFHLAYRDRLAGRREASRQGFRRALEAFEGQHWASERLLARSRLAEPENDEAPR